MLFCPSHSFLTFYFFRFYSCFFTIFHFKSHILVFHFLTPFCLLPSPSLCHFKFYSLLFFTLFLFLTLIISSPSILSKSFYFPSVISILFSFLQYSYSLSAFINLCPFVVDVAVVVFLQFVPIFHYIKNLFQISYFTLPFSYSICLLPSLSHLHFKIYFSFSLLLLFPTLIISPSPTLSKSFFFPLVTSYSFLIILLLSFHLY